MPNEQISTPEKSETTMLLEDMADIYGQVREPGPFASYVVQDNPQRLQGRSLDGSMYVAVAKNHADLEGSYTIGMCPIDAPDNEVVFLARRDGVFLLDVESSTTWHGRLRDAISARLDSLMTAWIRSMVGSVDFAPAKSSQNEWGLAA